MRGHSDANAIQAKRLVAAAMAKWLTAAVLIGGLLGPSLAAGQDAARSSAEFVPVTDAMLQEPAPEDWPMWRRTLDSWGYSPLDQIDTENVHRLALVWARPLAERTAEITPLAYGGVLYVPNTSDLIQALDATTGNLIWEYQRELPDGIFGRVGPLARDNRNIAIYGRSILDTSVDSYAFALDALTGELQWETRISDWKTDMNFNSAGPIVADGRLISGRSCRPRGGPDTCFIVAHDAKTGEELWRTRTIPRPGEPGDESWGDVPYEQRHHVGTWMPPSYDPQLELIYFGTSVTAPTPKFMLGGSELQHLYHNSTLALDVETGKIQWYYQHMIDHWDLDHPFERMLVDTAVTPSAGDVDWINPGITPGEQRRVITGIPGKTGLVYTLDRETGEFLWARETVVQNVISSIDGRTGRATENKETVFREMEQEVLVCPTWFGGKDWEAGAYSPLTNSMYFPLRNSCARMLATDNLQSERAKQFGSSVSIYNLAVDHQLAPGKDKLGTVHAISVESGKTEWLFETRGGTYSVATTGGGLVFGGDEGGWFRAFSQKTGEVLWEVNLGSAVVGYPISYAVGGRQYVAVNTGGGRAYNKSEAPEQKPGRASNLFVFALRRDVESGACSVGLRCQAIRSRTTRPCTSVSRKSRP